MKRIHIFSAYLLIISLVSFSVPVPSANALSVGARVEAGIAQGNVELAASPENSSKSSEPAQDEESAPLSSQEPNNNNEEKPAPREEEKQEPSQTQSRGMVSLSFDDGYRDAYTEAYPLLQRYGLQGTFYVVSGYVGFEGFMTQEHILELEQNGHEIGAHTRRHRDLTTLSEDEARDEVAGSRQDLFDMGVKRVDTFAYPFGKYNEDVVRIVKEAGFTGARTTNGGMNTQETDPYLLEWRKADNTSFETIKAWIDEAEEQGTWIIITFHRLNDSGEEFSASPEVLRQTAEYLARQNTRVVPIADGL